MSNYTETTNFTALTATHAVINGAAFDLEYGAIAVAIASKLDSGSTNVVITAPPSGNSLAIQMVAGGAALLLSTAVPTDIPFVINGTALGQAAMAFNVNGIPAGYIGVAGNTGQLSSDSIGGDVVIRSNGGNMRFNVNSGGVSAMIMGSNGGIVMGAPIGGDMGPGTLNVAALYINGVAVTAP